MIEVYQGRGSHVAREAVQDSADRYKMRENPKCADVRFNNVGVKQRADGSDYQTDADHDYFRHLRDPLSRASRGR